MYLKKFIKIILFSFFIWNHFCNILFDAATFYGKENIVSFNKESKIIHHKGYKSNKKWQGKSLATYSYANCKSLKYKCLKSFFILFSVHENDEEILCGNSHRWTVDFLHIEFNQHWRTYLYRKTAQALIQERLIKINFTFIRTTVPVQGTGSSFLGSLEFVLLPGTVPYRPVSIPIDTKWVSITNFLKTPK